MNLDEIKHNKNTKWYIIGGIALIIILAIAFGTSCGGDKPNASDPLANFKPNKAEIGEDWKTFRHDTSFNVWLFKEEDYPVRPQEHQKPNGARVFWNGEVTDEELNLINSGLSEMLTMCRRDQPNWNPPNIWTKYPYFQNVSDYKVLFVPSNYTVQEGESAGCAGIITGAHGDCGGGEGTCSAAGTVGGLNERGPGDSMPGGGGGVYIIVPKQSAKQLERPACKEQLKNGVRNEGMHVFFSNDSGIYFAHANDANTPDHLYCGTLE
jgi:hypothetical protein